MDEGGQRLRIAMLGHKRVPSREGGVEVAVEELAVRMAARGHCVTCYNRPGHHAAGAQYDAVSAGEYRGVRLRRVPALAGKGLLPASSSVFAAIAAAFGPYDIVHFHAEGPALMCWLPKLAGKRVIVTIHGLDHRREKWGRIARAYLRWGERAAVRHADEIIVLSQAARRYFAAVYGREARHIPNGVERRPRRSANLINRFFGLNQGGYLLFLGRIVPEKGLRGLIEAFKRVRTRKRLVIAGGPSGTEAFMDEIKRAAREDGRILFTGFVQGRVKHELFSNAYLYVLPSDVEGMPLSLLEGMSYGNCCLVSDIAECTEVVEDRAAVFRHGDAEDLARVLQALCDSPETVERYRRGASAFVCGKYSWEDAVDRTLELYAGRGGR